MSAPPRPRSVPLAERQSEARDLAALVKEHRRTCIMCVRDPTRRSTIIKCGTRVWLDEELARARHDIRHWFDPGPGDMTLF